ncbi:acetyl-CoA carboxylase biotin carboxyl carrier protein subunit [Prevotella sp. TCVGH]|uniref:biotin/lipoyl-containing protein n=1 Tax=Prevotella sp. TCVGH TaxID=2182433 RepID=UPI00201D7AF6|nr:biotin/lipoyl-containing protein [Prevotella sp. TCVGH]MCL6748684.1 acetyl-CoA carboxylase biotin carboxyl carrier protein subunit [Prevotella sp. TCVGH]
MKTFKYIIDGKEYQVEITDVVDNKAQVTVNGKDFQVEMEAQPEAEKKTVTQLPQSDEKVETETSTTGQVNTEQAIKAPLPGVITEIKVSVGDQVKAGDTVVVLEAMKMANNIEAEKDGTVTAICIKQGESVMEDTPLVVIE